MNFVGTFLVFGKDYAPEVHMLNQQTLTFLNQRLESPADRDNVRRTTYRHIFGIGAEYALPCWSRECMAAIGIDKMKWFKSPHAAEVKRIAACIALGKPYTLDEGKRDDGNAYDRMPEDKPIKPMPPASVKAEKEPVLVGAPSSVVLKVKRRK